MKAVRFRPGVRWTLFLMLLLGTVAWAAPVQVVVTIENLAPTNGTYLTPPWVGFHNGSFDLYDSGASASGFGGLEDLAEDGNTGPISTRFTNEGDGTVQGTLSGPIAPGGSVQMLFLLDSESMMDRYFSYAAMVIPSNDAFIANGDPTAHPIFDDMGNFVPVDFIFLGNMVLDAGTEVNDELPMNTAFFGQAAPNTGVDEDGVVMPHPGFHPPGSGGILDDPMFANADFLADGYQVARISVDVVPEPASVALFGLGLAAIGLRQRMTRRRQ